MPGRMQWASIALNDKHIGMAFLNFPVYHCVSVIRSWAYFHLPCPVVQWAPVVLNYKHLSMAFLISPVDHVVSIVRSWTYFTCLVTQSAPVVLKNKHFRMAFLSCPVHHGIWIVRSIEYRLHLAWPSNAARCAALFPTCKHSVKTRVLRQWAVLLLLEWVAICLKIEGIWTYNIHWHFIYI